MAKTKATKKPASNGSGAKTELLAELIRENLKLRTTVRELVDAVNGLRDSIPKTSLELLTPESRKAMDAAITRADELLALETLPAEAE